MQRGRGLSADLGVKGPEARTSSRSTLGSGSLALPAHGSRKAQTQAVLVAKPSCLLTPRQDLPHAQCWSRGSRSSLLELVLDWGPRGSVRQRGVSAKRKRAREINKMGSCKNGPAHQNDKI